MTKLHWPSHNNFSSLHLPASSFKVVTFAYTKLQTLPLCATPFIFTFRRLLLSFNYLFFFVLSFIIFYFFVKLYRNEHCWHEPHSTCFLVVLLAAPAFEEGFISLDPLTKIILNWVAKAAVPVAREIMVSVKVEALRRNIALKLLQFLKSENLALRELQTEQIYQGPRASLTVHTYTMKDGRIQEIFLYLFHNWNSRVSLLNRAWFFWLVLNKNQANAHLPSEMRELIALVAQLYYHSLALVCRKGHKKSLTVPETQRILRWKAWRSILWGKLGMRSRSLDCLIYCKLWHSHTCGSIRYFENLRL